MSTPDAILFIELEKKLFAQINQVKKEFKGMRGSIENVEKTSKKSFQSINSQLKQISFVQITQGLQNLNQAFQDINGPGLDYNSTLAELSAITGLTGAKLDELGKKARESAKNFGGSASESLNTYKVILSKLGPDIANSTQALDEMESYVRTLSKTMGGDNVKAVEALTTSMLQYGVDLSNPIAASKEMEKMMNVMAASAQAGSSEVDQVAESWKVAGVQIKQAKVSFEEGTAAIQVLSKGGKDGAEAGTALRNILTKMAGEDIIPKEAAGKLKALGVDLSIVSDTSISLSDRLKELKKAQSDATVMAQVFGLENAAAANILLDGVGYMDELTEKITDTNVAYDQANIIMESRAEKIKKMNAYIEDQKIALFEATNGATAYLEPISELAVTFSAFVPLVSGAKKAFDALKKSQIVQTTVQKALNVVSKIFNKILSMNPILLVTAGIAAATAAMYGLIKATKGANAVEKVHAKLKDKIAEKTKDQRVEVEILFEKLKSTKKGTTEYNKALKELDQLLPGIVKKYNLQEGALNNINAAHQEAIKLIEERAKAEAAQEMLKETMSAIITKEKEIAEIYASSKELAQDHVDYYGTSDGTVEELTESTANQLWVQNRKDELAELIKEKDAIINIIKPNDKNQIAPSSKDQIIESIQKKLDEGKFVPDAVLKKYGFLDSGNNLKTPKTSSNSLVKSTVDTKTYSGPEKTFKNINIRIDKLGCDLTFKTTNMTESKSQLKKVILETLVGGVRDAEIALGT